MKKFLSIILTIVLASFMLVGCNQTDKKTKKIGLIVSTLNNPFFVDLKKGVEKEAKELGYEVVVLDSQNDPAKEVSNMEDITVKDVDLVLLNPVDSDSAVASVMIANNADLPVMTVDRVSNGGKVLSHIASDNIAGGDMAAKFLIDKLGNKGNIVELEGIAGSSATRDRGKGFEDGIKGSNLKIIAKQSADFDRTKGLSVMENIIQSKGDINAVFAQNDEMALGASKALEDANMNNVLVVGFDATDDAVDSVKKGTMAATVAQQPILIGETAVKVANKYLNGEKVDDFIPVELQLVTK
ncbi:ribose ABC transporter substrate-binding protein RbsB [Paraclostridium sordellii]|uniref:ribose ABC transporter substrate-binding protein RbsB n=1 Tax=Paraclostridium sordellii TaxID=1505 RepID=UPI0005DEE3CB|nr:ribose ABC transporter substrate-binding protein RbsB [Paeniclostridium sordellii]MDU1454043.1 ribose ABC transporter substrate-binding protein RbsB [Paeniclostridium sordellii]CEP80832.1 ribose ABC transporter substrate-binding protein [[Clostridium] sordellii] [Paeniclostridium sordellii]CEP95813.1 ribose ABC transporter substrate-binding protein [[Clostridium] sordellii] [Paeniclostridium sordellii]